MPQIDESDLDVGNEPPFVARKISIKNTSPKADYSFSDELGRGRFGTVLKCTEKKTGLKLAAKFVSTKHGEERENVEREVDIMKSLQHRRLLQLYDVYDDGVSEMCIITELINGGELFERVIDDDFELTEKICAIFMRQICEGVEYMHSKRIMHLDMKPENILCVSLTGNRVKLIDFGLARRYDPNKKLQVMFGTPDFAAPEVLSYERVTPAADMWSVGVICYVLLSGLSPFMGNSDLETMTNVTRAVYDFDDESFDPISAEAKDFIAKLLVKDPQKRLTPTECLQHKWLAKTPAKRGKATQLSKTKLKKYVVRRRWQKAVTAIMALTRMGANLSLGGGSAFGRPAVGAGVRPQVARPSANKTSSTSSSSSITTSSATHRVSSTGGSKTNATVATVPPSTGSRIIGATGGRAGEQQSVSSRLNASKFPSAVSQQQSSTSSKRTTTTTSSSSSSASNFSARPTTTTTTTTSTTTGGYSSLRPTGAPGAATRISSTSSSSSSSTFATSSSSYRVSSPTIRRRF